MGPPEAGTYPGSLVYKLSKASTGRAGYICSSKMPQGDLPHGTIPSSAMRASGILALVQGNTPSEILHFQGQSIHRDGQGERWLAGRWRKKCARENSNQPSVWCFKTKLIFLLDLAVNSGKLIIKWYFLHCWTAFYWYNWGLWRFKSLSLMNVSLLFYEQCSCD